MDYVSRNTERLWTPSRFSCTKNPNWKRKHSNGLGPSRFKIRNKDLADLLVPVYAKAREYVGKEIKRAGTEGQYNQ